MDRWKSRGGKSQTREEKKRKSQEIEDAGARKGSKVAKHCVFQKKVGAEGRKVGSLKRQVRSHLAKWEVKNCMPLWREAHFEVKVRKTHQLQNTFRTWDVELAHAVVAGSTFRSQNVQNTPPFLDHFRCGAKHISKSKVGKTEGFGALLDVRMSFLRGRYKGFCTLPKVSETWRFCGIFDYNHHYTTLHYTRTTTTTTTTTTLHYTTLIALHYTTLHSTTLH